MKNQLILYLSDQTHFFCWIKITTTCAPFFYLATEKKRSNVFALKFETVCTATCMYVFFGFLNSLKIF